MNTDKLIELGSEWQKGENHRVYFNDLSAWYGLRLVRYNSGNIQSATFDGEAISNSYAKEIDGKFVGVRVWFDFADGEFHSQGTIKPGAFNKIVNNIKAAAEVA